LSQAVNAVTLAFATRSGDGVQSRSPALTGPASGSGGVSAVTSQRFAYALCVINGEADDSGFSLLVADPNHAVRLLGLNSA